MSKRDVKQITLRLPLEVDEALKEISEINRFNPDFIDFLSAYRDLRAEPHLWKGGAKPSPFLPLRSRTSTRIKPTLAPSASLQSLATWSLYYRLRR